MLVSCEPPTREHPPCHLSSSAPPRAARGQRRDAPVAVATGAEFLALPGGRRNASERVRHFSTEYRLHSPGTPFRACVPRSTNRIPEPTTRSLTVLDTSTSPGSA